MLGQDFRLNGHIMIEWAVEIGMLASAFLAINCFVLVYLMLGLVPQKAIVLIILWDFLQDTHEVINMELMNDRVHK